MSESCAPTSEEESSDEEHSDDEGDELKSLNIDGGEKTSEILSCEKFTAVNQENIYENDEKEMDGYNINSLFEKEDMTNNERTCVYESEGSIKRSSSLESSSYLFEIRVDETDSKSDFDNDCNCGSDCSNESESDCESGSGCCSESDCESDCKSDCSNESDCEYNCEVDSEKEGESVTDNVVWYRFNEECNECVLSEENKANFAKWFNGRTVKKRVSVVDSDDEW